MSLYRDKAIVLRTWKLGEADRIISLHTRISGKVRCVAKGVRRTRSKFGSRLEPACHVEVQLHRGRGELDIVTQATTINRFLSLRSDPNRFARASAMLEVVEQLSLDREPDSDRHVMLAKALATLDYHDSPMVVAGFFLKLLAQEGVKPVLDFCVTCGSDRAIDTFNLLEGGVMCRHCRRNRSQVSCRRSLSPKALELLRLILGGGLVAALNHPYDTTAKEVISLSTEAIELHIERRVRSLSIVSEV